MKSTSIIVLALTFLAAPLAAERTPLAALGNGGELYELRLGSRQELFPDAAAGHPVLALDVATADGRQRRLVPGTGGAAVERNPLLVYDRSHDAVNLIWESHRRDGSVAILLARFDAEQGFSDPVELFRHQAGTEINAVRALTEDRYAFTLPDGRRVRSERSILHLLWQAERDGTSELRYAPVIFVDGRYAGRHHVFVLDQLFDATGDPAGGAGGVAPAASLRRAVALEIRPGGLLVGFVDPRDDRLVVLRIGVLPLEIAYLADEIHRRVLEDFGGPGAQGDIRTVIIHGGIRTVIIHGGIEVGADPALVAYVADTAEAWSEAFFELNPEASLEEYASALRAFVVDLTSAILSTATGDDGSTIEIDLDDLAGGDQPAQVLDLRVVSSRPAPATGEGLSRIYLGDGGRRMLVAWHDAEAGVVHWRESDGDGGWSEPRTLRLDQRTNLVRADALLRDRAR
ncbi:MAG: hypothetical protein D6696_10240 [Acidobacteria bacterium]|nr:MAG: hypothetical protein D6696_10240 [Acidobacteriota bacterium]